MSGSEERTKLLTDEAATDSSAESDVEGTKPVETPEPGEPPAPTKDAIAVEELAPQDGTQDQPVSAPHSELPPPYESGKGDIAGPTAQPAGGYYGDGTTPSQMGGYGVSLPPPAAHSSVQNQTTVVQVQPYSGFTHAPPPPPNYLGLAIFATLCCFWPLGIAAIIKSSEVNKFHGMGSYELARQSSEKARSYSRMSIIIGIILNIVGGAFMCAFIAFRVIGGFSQGAYHS